MDCTSASIALCQSLGIFGPAIVSGGAAVLAIVGLWLKMSQQHKQLTAQAKSIQAEVAETKAIVSNRPPANEGQEPPRGD
jgi:hypothetical protein